MLFNRRQLVRVPAPSTELIDQLGSRLFAGGIFTFPLLSPLLSARLNLTQTQLTTIVLAGMVGQYPFSAFVGRVIDYHGPSTCSLIASVLFSSAFTLISMEMSKGTDNALVLEPGSFHKLSLCFFIAGLGTVFSYFSSLFAASKSFPDYPGLSSGATMSLFGLSPLFLCTIASEIFTTAEGLDASHFLSFLALCAGLVHLNGAVNLRIPAAGGEDERSAQTEVHADETTRLLPPEPANAPTFAPSGSDNTSNDSVLSLLRDSHFWTLLIFLFITLGSCEMILANIGTIVLALPPSTTIRDLPVEAAVSAQVKLLSLANTVSRLVSGALADFVSPISSYSSPEASVYSRRHRTSRVVFLSGASLLLAWTFLLVNLRVQTRETIWILSIGSGIAYGTIFTVLPGIVSSVWGPQNLGRNFGLITYAPFLGTPCFSYIYAFVVTDLSGTEPCRGAACWHPTFWLCSGMSILAFGGTLLLWRGWKGRV